MTASFVEIGQGFACAIDDLGRPQCWGTNFDGELGRITNTGNAPQAPAAVPGVTDVTVLASAVDHTCVLGSKDGEPSTILCWGGPRGFAVVGEVFEEGDVVTPPTLDDAFARNAFLLDADGDASGGVTCAGDGVETYCWGPYAPGSPDGRATAVAALSGATTLSVSIEGICGRVAGALVCVEVGSTLSALGCLDGAPCAALNDASQYSVTAGHTCKSVGAEVLCAGENTYGQVVPGIPGAAEPLFVDTLIDGGLVRAGLQHACALDATNAVVCWGRMLDLQTGRDDLDDVAFTCATTEWCQGPAAVPMPDGISLFTQLTTRRAQSCALDVDGRVVCWGDLALTETGQVIPPTEIVLSP